MFQTSLLMNNMDNVDARVVNVQESNQLNIHNGHLLVSFSSLKGLDPDLPLFKVKMRKSYAGDKIRGINISSGGFASESYDRDLITTYDLSLVKEILPASVKTGWSPNPADDYTVLSYRSDKDEDEDLTINVYNITGQLVRKYSRSAVKGFNSFEIELEGIESQVLIIEVRVKR